MTMGALTTALYSHERHKPGQIQHVSNQEGDVSQTETAIMKDQSSPKTNVQLKKTNSSGTTSMKNIKSPRRRVDPAGPTMREEINMKWLQRA